MKIALFLLALFVCGSCQVYGIDLGLPWYVECSDPNCSKCRYNPAVGIVCLGCNHNYQLSSDELSCFRKPTLCQVPNCANCTEYSQNLCSVCSKNYFINPTIGNAYCEAQCLAPNCRECVSGNHFACADCAQDYYLTENRTCKERCKASNCQTCLSESATACAACKDGYLLIGSTCEPACIVPGCKICQSGNNTVCTLCNNGYLLIGSTCEPACIVPDCKTCQSGNNTVCTLCKPGYTLIGNTCQRECTPENCALCREESSSICEQCVDGYSLVQPYGLPDFYRRCDPVNPCSTGYTFMEDGSCQQCLVANCTDCVANNPNACSTCDTNFIRDGNTCKHRCDIWGCASCAYASPTLPPTSCEMCQYGLSLQGGSCYTCQVESCLRCDSSSPQVCVDCMDGYQLVEGKCRVPCNVMPNCRECMYEGSEQWPAACRVCEDGYVRDIMDMYGNCIPGCSDPACEFCLHDNPDFCVSCSGGLLPDDFGQCGGILEEPPVVCPGENCLACEPSQPDFCYQCSGDLIPDENGICGGVSEEPQVESSNGDGGAMD